MIPYCPRPLGLTSISFDELQKRIRLSKYGSYNSVLANNESKEGKFRLREDLNLFTDKITMISNKGVTSYTMAVEQNSKQKATFQNVTFVERNGNIETYLLTYRASKAWASRLKIDKKAPFEGYFSYSKLESKKSKTSENKVSADGCETFTYYYTVAHQCEGYNGGQYHWPWESCPWAGQSNGPGYYTYGRSITVCSASGNTWVTGLTGDGSGGGSGGGTPTYPTLPLNYNPDCNYGYSGVSSLKSSGLTTSAVGDDCPYDDPNPAGLIANINKLTGILGLDWAKQKFLHNMDALQGKTLTLDLLAYLNVNGVTAQNIDFGNWAVNHLISNPNTDYNFFKDQYLGNSEGMDGNYDAAFWENPNLIFQTKALPSLQAFLEAFPKIQNGNSIRGMSASNVFSLVGGNMLIKHLIPNPNYQNACAIRGSRALNYMGVQHELPEFSLNGELKTEKGDDNKNYILAAKAFNIYMNQTYGAPSARLTSLEIGNDLSVVSTFLQGKTGIYTLVTNNSGQAGYSGHVDLIYNGQVLSGAAINPKGGIKFIEIWVLN